MRLTLVPYVLASIGLAIVAVGLLKRAADPPHVVATGVFKFTDRAGAHLLFPQRVVAGGGFETTEIQLPGGQAGGTWIDCRTNCADALLAARSQMADGILAVGR